MRSLHSNLRHKHCQQLKFLSSKIFALQAERSTRKGRGRCRTHGRGWRRCTGLKAGVAYFRDERNYCWYCVPMQSLTTHSVAVWETTKKHVAMYGETWEQETWETQAAPQQQHFLYTEQDLKVLDSIVYLVSRTRDWRWWTDVLIESISFCSQ